MNLLVLCLVPTLGVSSVSADSGPSLARAPRDTQIEYAWRRAGAVLSPESSKDSAYDLSALKTLSRANLHIRENYVEPERIKPYEMFLAALDYIQRLIPEVMVDDSQAPTRVVVSAGNHSQAFDLGEIDQLWEVTMALHDIFRFLQTHITDINKQRDIEYAAVNGMLSCLDPHSILLKPENFDEMKLSTKGEFGGLGIVISIRDGGLTIIAPIEGTPAGQAGLRAKDKIVKIGEESTINMGLDEAVQLLRGKPDSQVTIWVQRKGWTEPKQIVLTRAIIKIESVTSELLDHETGYIKIKSFQGNTFDDLETHLQRLKHKNKGKELRGLILDLRNNPGGLLDQAILVSDRFISRGPLVITVGEGNRRREVKYAHPGPGEDAYPISVLVNGGSASASEIVAGALKNHDRAVVVGQQSFGKGSVQILYDFKDRSALKLTIAQYLTPGDISIQSVGIVPDVTVVPAVLERNSVHLFVDDEAPREKDLDHHLNQHSVAQLSSSAFKLYHLSEKERDDLDPAVLVDEEIATGKFEYDFETHLAHDILATAKSHARPEILKGAQGLLEQRMRGEDANITHRMAELDVNWQKPDTSAAASKPAVAKVSWTPKASRLLAGETVHLQASVENTGERPLYRVFGTTTSDNPLLRGLEFPFGHVAPHSRRSWDVNIKLPHDMMARADSVTLKLGDAENLLSTLSGQTQVDIAEPPRPQFAYAAQVVDFSEGNGDGLLQPGEVAGLDVRVTNVGEGVAEDVTVTVKNLSGTHLFLQSGRDKLGPLKPKETKVAHLKFKVHGPDSAPVREIRNENDETEAQIPQVAPKFGDSLSLRLGIFDAANAAILSDHITLPVARAKTSRPSAAMVRTRAKKSVALYAAPEARANTIGCLLPKARVRSEANVGEFLRVVLDNGQRAFIRQADTVVVRGNPKTSKSEVAYRSAAPRQAPRIELTDHGSIIEHEIYPLKGKIVSDRPLLDMFVFVGEKKVYFHALDNLVPQGGSYSFSFNIPLHLKPGTNAVGMVVRENEDLIARHVVGILRTQGHEVPSAQGENPSSKHDGSHKP